MEIIQLCPICGSVGIKVPHETVKSISILKEEIDPSSKFSACLTNSCEVAYFFDNETIKISEVSVPFWYKDNSENVPICYCSKLTRKEIENAVSNGCKDIDAVQDFTGKHITGKCKTENPLGLCCRNVFLREMSLSGNKTEKR